MAVYEKLPVRIDAVPVVDVIACIRGVHTSRIDKWVNDAIEAGDIRAVRGEGGTFPRLHITTLEGVHYAELDDMLIRGVKGELYGCKPDIFAATYRLVSQ